MSIIIVIVVIAYRLTAPVFQPQSIELYRLLLPDFGKLCYSQLLRLSVDGKTRL